jgi:ribosomal protein S18 acetylase RimI-like enzyme
MNSEEVKIILLKANAQKLESWIAMLNGDIVGHIYMQREDDKKIKFLDAWVHSDYRRKGIYRMLWDTRWEYVQEKYKGWTVYAWCKETSLPLLMEKGFTTGDVCTYVEKEI